MLPVGVIREGVRDSRSRSRSGAPGAPDADTRRHISRQELNLSFVCSESFSGGYIGGVTPVPIPNTEVKPSRADGTPRETARESRSPPGFLIDGRQSLKRGWRPSPFAGSLRGRRRSRRPPSGSPSARTRAGSGCLPGSTSRARCPHRRRRRWPRATPTR